MSKKIRINYSESRNKIQYLKSDLFQLSEEKKIEEHSICSMLDQGAGETVSECVSLIEDDSSQLFSENIRLVEDILDYMEYACNRYERQEEYIITFIKKMGRRK